jgi:hypothetical protein
MTGRVTFVLGTAGGGLLLGTLMYLLAALVEQYSAAGWFLVGFLLLLALGGLLGKRPALGLKRQVSHADIVRREPALALAQWGLQLGFGFATYAGTALLAAYVAASVLILTPVGALLAGMFYGVSRGLVTNLASRVEDRTPEGSFLPSLRHLATVTERAAWVPSAGLAVLAMIRI